jgi:dienelactone hydrolase
MWVPSDGSSEVLMAAQYTIYSDFPEFWPTVYRVDVATGKKRVALRGREGVMDWSADASGEVRTGMRYADGTRRFSLLYRGEEGEGSFRTIDKADSRKQELPLRPFLFLPGTDHALVLHDDDEGRSAIFEVDLLTREDIRTVFTAPAGAEVEGITVSADGKELLGVLTSEAENDVHWVNPELAALQAQFDKAVGDRKARIVSMSRDRSRMLVHVSRPDHPGTIYFFDVADGILRQVAQLNETIGNRRLSPVRMVKYKARDGLEIEAVLTLPLGAEPRNLPIVMLPHGGPWGQDGLTYDYWAQFIASRGYAVIQPNFRGSTGYGTEFMKKGQGQMGLAMQDDITDGLRWAVAQGIADPKRACIAGASYGGYAAMWGVAKDPEQYRCAISVSGVANLRREVNDFGDSLYGAKYKDDWQRMTPDFAAVSPINAVARIKAPLLLVHGKKDVTVDHGQSSSMHGRMRDAGKDVEFVSLPEADHYFTRQADREVLLGSIEAFLAKHNPAGQTR